MSFYNIFGDEKTDTELGTIVFDRYISFYNQKYFKLLTYEDLAIAMGFKNKTAILIDGVGLMFRTLGENYSDLDEAMKMLVIRGGGKLPTKPSFDAALRDEATYVFSFVEYQKNAGSIGYVAAGVADKILDGLEYTGNKTIDAGKQALDSVSTLITGAVVITLVGYGAYVLMNVQAAPKIKVKK